MLPFSIFQIEFDFSYITDGKILANFSNNIWQIETKLRIQAGKKLRPYSLEVGEILGTLDAIDSSIILILIHPLLYCILNTVMFYRSGQ